MTPESQKPEEYLDRRGFLVRMTAILGGAIALVLGGSGAAYVLSPALRRKKEEWIEVTTAGAIPEGVPTKVDYVKRQADGWMMIEGRSSVWLLKQKNEMTAFDPKCTHLGCPYRWDEAKETFVCPCHTAVFSKTGEVVSGPPPRALDRFPVKIERGIVSILPESKAA